MKKDVYVLTNINHYSNDELYVYANVYGSALGARADMIEDFKARLDDTFDSDEKYIFGGSDDEYMELKSSSECFCTWSIDRQSVEFDQ